MKFFPTTNNEWRSSVSFIVCSCIILEIIAAWPWQYYLSITTKGGHVPSDLKPQLWFVFGLNVIALAYLLVTGFVEWRARRTNHSARNFCFAIVPFLIASMLYTDLAYTTK